MSGEIILAIVSDIFNAETILDFLTYLPNCVKMAVPLITYMVVLYL